MEIISVGGVHLEFIQFMTGNDVHIWQVAITDAAVYLDECQQVLQQEETQRAIRFRSKTDQTRFIVSREQGLLMSLPINEQRKLFFELWTLQEAFGKMRGDGLTDEVENMDIVSVLQEKNDHLLETLTPASGYMAAVALKGNARRIIQFDDLCSLFN